MSTARPLVLASASPRREALLREAGFVFSVRPADIEESARPDELPEALAERLALLKAQSVADRTETEHCVLGADTIVVLDRRILGKPRDGEEAVEMLLSLAGRTHRVLTGYALVVTGAAIQEVGVEESRVRLRAVDEEEARRYAASGEPLDKAGAYAVQGEGGRFVERIDGSRSNVIGLPLEVVLPRLEKYGVRARWES